VYLFTCTVRLYCAQATMEFPDLSMGQYISKQYTQNVANALSSVTNVPTSSISTLDVRPFTGAARTATPKRLLLQDAGNGVQATYFLATEDPNGVSERLSAAANDGTLSARLAQYGITAQAGGLRVQNYLQPPPAAPPARSFPLWALAPIIVGGLLLLGLVALLAWCCCFRKKRGQKAPAYAPGPVKQTSYNKTPSGRSVDDVAVARDMQPKGGYDAPAYTTAGAAGGYGAYKAAAPTYQAPPSTLTPTVHDSPTKGNGAMPRGAGIAAGVAAAGTAAAAAGTAAALKRSGSSKGPRPESPGKHSGSNVVPSGIAGAAAGAGAGGAAGTPAHLSTLQSMKVRGVGQEEPIARSGSGGSGSSNTLTPWEASARGAGDSSGAQMQAKGPAGPAASSGVTGSSMRSAGVGAAGAGVAAGAVGAAALSGARSGSLAPASSSELAAQGSGSTTGWKSNVRPASGQMPASGVC
jgi:hypothetical protein